MASRAESIDHMGSRGALRVFFFEFQTVISTVSLLVRELAIFRARGFKGKRWNEIDLGVYLYILPLVFIVVYNYIAGSPSHFRDRT